MSKWPGATPGWITLNRQLADAAGDVDAFRATYTAQAMAMPSDAAEIGRRLLDAGRIEEAEEVLLRPAVPTSPPGNKTVVDPSWESIWIDYLERTGSADEAQAVRWASFERSLCAERARAFIARLAEFDDVEAEARALAYAANYPVFEAALRFLMEWPSLGEAARMIVQRQNDVRASPEAAELWAGKLRRRHPKAAHLLLRSAAAAAFGRRDFRACDRLTQEAETITLPG